MADENKISIDVTINGDAQKQIDQYVRSFDNLRSSLNGLSQPFNSFSNNINSLDRNISKYTESLNKLNVQNREIVSSGDKADNKISDLSTSFLTWNGIIKIVTDGIKAWEFALTGGLAIITAFGPEIIKWASALLKGNAALEATVQNFKNFNDVMKTSNKDASAEITRLQILYKSATDVNNSYHNRLLSVRELKKEFPDHFKAINNESILNGNAKKSYEELTRSIIENAKARAAETKIAELANQQLEIDFKKSKIINAKNNELKRIKPVTQLGQYSTSDKMPELLSPEKQQQAVKDQQQANRDLLRGELREQDAKKRILQNQIDFFVKFAGGNNKIAAAIAADNGDMGAHPKRHKQDTGKIHEEITRNSQLLQAKSITFAKQIQLDKQNYDTEVTLLNDQLSNKLISQESYNQQSEQLQEKYHLAIGEKIKAFSANELNDVKKYMQAIVDAHQHEEVMTNDHKKINKAILPWQKFNAEKQLIADKYNYEITFAKGNSEKVKDLEDQKQKDITQLTEKYEQQRKAFAIQAAQQISSAAFSLISNSIKSSSDAKIKGMESDKAKELSNTNLTKTQRAAIEAKYKKKENDEKVKAFKANQKMQIAQAVINGAIAVSKTISEWGMPLAIPFIVPTVAMTAIQIATIASQKPPAFAKGGRFVSDGRGALLPGYSRADNTNAYLRSGEAVVVSEAMRNPWARNLVSAINVAHGGRDFSAPNTGNGYAIGGIFTDGGNANRYYNQPVNDIKEMANTVAYQMINNFPPIYVDVKDVNNQQNILAQTVDRVNL